MPRNDVTVRFRADTGQAKTELQIFGDKLKGLQRNIKDNLLGIGLFAGAVVGMGHSVRGFINIAKEQENALATLAQVTNNTGFAFSQYRDRIMDTTAALQAGTNFGDEFQQRILARMIPILGDVDQALAALPAVLDAATVSGNDAFTVANTLTKALAGQANMAESVGLKFDAAAGFSERLAQTFAAVGGAAEANADPFEQLANDWGDLQETIGSFLVGPATELIQWLRDAAQGYAALGGAIQDFFSSQDEVEASIQAIIDSAPTAAGQLRSLEDEYRALTIKAAELTKVVNETRGVDVQRFTAASITLQETEERLELVSDAYNELQKATDDAAGSTAGWNRTAKEAEDIFRENARLQLEFEKNVRLATLAIEDQRLAQQEANRAAHLSLVEEQIQRGVDERAKERQAQIELRNQRQAQRDAAKAADQERAAKEAKQLETLNAKWSSFTDRVKIAGSQVGKAGLSMQQTFEVLQTAGVDIDDLTQKLIEAGIETSDYAGLLRFLERQGYDVVEMFGVQEAAIRKQEDAMRALKQQAQAAAAAMAATASQFAGRGPTVVPVARSFTDAPAAGIFGSLSTIRRSELGTPDVEAFQQFFFDLVSRMVQSGVDRTSALMKAVQQLEGFDTGGVVPGPVGSPRLAMVHGGETILPTHRGGGMMPTVNISFDGAIINGIDEFDAELERLVVEKVGRAMHTTKRRK